MWALREVTLKVFALVVISIIHPMPLAETDWRDEASVATLSSGFESRAACEQTLISMTGQKSRLRKDGKGNLYSVREGETLKGGSLGGPSKSVRINTCISFDAY